MQPVAPGRLDQGVGQNQPLVSLRPSLIACLLLDVVARHQPGATFNDPTLPILSLFGRSGLIADTQLCIQRSGQGRAKHILLCASR